MQRSLPAFDSPNMHFLCLRGKQRAEPNGFRWAAPSHLATIEFAIYEHDAALLTEPGLVIHASAGASQKQPVYQNPSHSPCRRKC